MRILITLISILGFSFTGICNDSIMSMDRTFRIKKNNNPTIDDDLEFLDRLIKANVHVRNNKKTRNASVIESQDEYVTIKSRDGKSVKTVMTGRPKTMSKAQFLVYSKLAGHSNLDEYFEVAQISSTKGKDRTPTEVDLYSVEVLGTDLIVERIEKLIKFANESKTTEEFRKNVERYNLLDFVLSTDLAIERDKEILQDRKDFILTYRSSFDSQRNKAIEKLSKEISDRDVIINELRDQIGKEQDSTIISQLESRIQVLESEKSDLTQVFEEEYSEETYRENLKIIEIRIAKDEESIARKENNQLEFAQEQLIKAQSALTKLNMNEILNPDFSNTDLTGANISSYINPNVKGAEIDDKTKLPKGWTVDLAVKEKGAIYMPGWKKALNSITESIGKFGIQYSEAMAASHGFVVDSRNNVDLNSGDDQVVQESIKADEK